jgi:phosphoglycolate phosphatase
MDKIKLIVFDYDGVIVDSFKNVHEAYKVIAEKMGKICPEDLEEFRKFYGYSYIGLRKRMGIREEENKESEIIYREEMEKQSPEIFDGISKVIENLSGKYKLVLVSSSPKSDIVRMLKEFGITNYFELVIASEELKPFNKTGAFLEVLEKYSLEPEEVIAIGDRNIDYNKGIDAGYKSENIILVEYGWGYDRNKVPDSDSKILVNDSEDILKAVEAIENSYIY